MEVENLAEKKYPRLYPYRGYEENYKLEIDKALEGLQELTLEEKKEAFDFENSLLDFFAINKKELPEEKTTIFTKILNIEEIYSISINSVPIYLNAFLSQKDDEGNEKSVGIKFLKDNIEKLKLGNITIPEFRSLEEIEEFFYMELDYPNIETAILKKLTEVGNTFTQDKFAEILIRAYKEDDEELRSLILKEANQFRRITIVANPNNLRKKIESLRYLKSFYKETRVELISQDSTDVNKAKKLVLDMHLHRVNFLLADLKVEEINYRRYIARSGKQEGTQQQNVSKEQRDIARIDKFMHGAGEMRDGNYSPITPELAKIAKDSSNAKPIKEVTAKSNDENKKEDATKIEEVKEAKKIEWNPNEAKRKFEKVLNKLNLLSSQTEYEFGRGKPAADGNWQSVIEEPRSVLGIDARTKAIKIPLNRAKGELTNSIVAHEIDHVMGNENKSRLQVSGSDNKKYGLRILDNVGLARISLNSEAGGKGAESENEPKTSKFTYLNAVQAKESGGTFAEAAMEFLVELRKDIENPEDENQLWENAKKAFSSAKRISSGMENFDERNTGYVPRSRDLVYSEQRIYKELLQDPKYSEFKDILKIGGMNLIEFAQLKRLGLIDTSNLLDIPEEFSSLLEFVNSVLSEEG
jgi:hypothetical protein